MRLIADKINLEELSNKEKVMLQDKEGNIRRGTVRIRAVNCGKPNCTKCPHKYYVYVAYRDGKKVKMHYLGNLQKYKF